MAQYSRPNSDISNTNWSPSTGSTLYGCIDETTASDTDYITGTSTSAVCEIGLSSVTDPQSSIEHTIRVRAKANGSGAGEKWTFQLEQGSTVIRALASAANLARTWTDLSATLTESEADSITDYSALSVYIAMTTGGAAESIDVSWVEFEVPDGDTSINGTLSGTLGDVTSSASGTVDISGSLDKSVDDVSISFAGTVDISGTASNSVGDVSISASGSVGAESAEGILESTLADCSISATGTILIGGVLTTNNDDVVITSTGEVDISGLADYSLDDISGLFQGEVDISGLADYSLDDISGLFQGEVVISGIAEINVADASIDFSGYVGALIAISLGTLSTRSRTFQPSESGVQIEFDLESRTGTFGLSQRSGLLL